MVRRIPRLAKLLVISLGLSLTWLCTPAPPEALAAVVLVDFTDTPNSAATLGGTWNAVGTGGAPVGTLRDSAGNTVAGLSISPDAFFVSNNDNTPVSAAWTPSNGWVDGAAVANSISGWAGTAGVTGTVTISGLTPGANYQVDYVAARSTDNSGGSPPYRGRTGDYQVNGVFADSSPDGDDFNAKEDGFLGGNFLTWNSATADAGGQIGVVATNQGVNPAPGGSGNGLYATALRIEGDFTVSPIGPLATYTFDGNQYDPPVWDLAPTNVPSNVTASDFDNGTGLDGGTPPNTYFYPSGTGNPSNGIGVRSIATASSEAGAVSGDDYLYFTLTPDTGFELDLNDLSFDLTWSNNTGPVPADREVFVRSSVDSFASTLGTFTAYNAGSGNPDPTDWETKLLDLSGPDFQDLTGPIEFRFYMYDGSAEQANAYRFDNVFVRGAVAQVSAAVIPEPSALLIWAAGLVGLAWFSRRRRK